jgi:exonuclease III
LIIAGDLNVALGPLDYRGSRPSHSNNNSCKALISLMDEFNLIDVWRNEHPLLRAYTRHQKNPPVLSRLDYILVSSNLADNVKNRK